jgi:integrase
LNAVPLATARRKASEFRTQVADGIDPLAIRQAERRIPTFGELADELIKQLEPGWRNDKHKAQWSMTLREYAKPLRSKPVDTIETGDVLKVLQPIWQTKPETAARVRGRIEKVLDSAKVKGFRSGENPAAWRGHLALVLPKRPALSRGHHERMEIDDVPEFMAKLRERAGIACRCLEFVILTVARSGEALGARWAEIDLEEKLWTMPPHRMKPGKEHRVPLSPRTIDILKEMAPLRDGDFVFPGMRRGKPLSNMALAMTLRRMRIDNATVHGFRSCFRDWTGNRTSYPRELAEHALSHTIGDKAEQAYRRDTAVERRRPLMEAWASFCDGSVAKIIALNQSSTAAA